MDENLLKNRQICSKLAELAQSIFKHVVSTDKKSSTFTAAEVDKEFGNSLFFDESYDYTADEEIIVGNFKCSFPKRKVFDILHKFEKLACVKKKQRFVYESDKKDVVISFDINISKESLFAHNFVDESEVKPCMNRILVDYKGNRVVSSNTWALVEQPVVVSNLCIKEDFKQDFSVLLSTEQFINGVGLSHVEVSFEGDYYVTTLQNESGESYSDKFMGTKIYYPNYRTVYPTELPIDGYFKFVDEDIIPLRKWVASCYSCSYTVGNKYKFRKPRYSKIPITMCFTAGSDTVTLKYDDSDLGEHKNSTFRLSFQSKHSIDISIRPLPFLAMTMWDGGIWIKGSTYPCIFDMEGGNNAIVMPNCPIVSYNIDGPKISTMERFNSVPYQQCHSVLQKSSEPQEKNKSKRKSINRPVKEQDYTMLMATKNKTQKKYSIEELEEGKYEIREQAHDPDLVHAIRSMAHYLRGRFELQVKIIKNFEKHYGSPKNNPDYFLNYPLPELELASRISEVLESEGIEDIPDYPSADSLEQNEIVVEEEIIDDAEERLDEETIGDYDDAEEEDNSGTVTSESTRSGLVASNSIVPIMTLETSEGPMIISTFEAFTILEESSNQKDRDLIDEIDAFISSKTFNSEPLDYEAIAAEVEDFLRLVSEQNQAI